MPSEQKRKFYIRIFKWVVAFATWKYGEKKLHLTALNGVSHSAELGRVDTSESMERLDSSIEKIDQDYDSDENLRKDSPGRAKPSKSSAHTIISASSPSKSTYRKHYALERHVSTNSNI